MTREQFIKLAAGSCIGLIAMTIMTESFGSLPPTPMPPQEENQKLTISREAFIRKKKKSGTVYRRYIILSDQALAYPVIIYRFGEQDFTALLMRCSHQGNELSVNGDILSCSAHGSEFSNKGEVLQGPAEHALTFFNVTSDETHVFLHLA